jgi:hypothetical protein
MPIRLKKNEFPSENAFFPMENRKKSYFAYGIFFSAMKNASRPKNNFTENP